jgi:hypothetical protein
MAISIAFSNEPANSQALILNKSSILGKWSIPAADSYAGVITIKNDGTFTFKGFKSPSFKSHGTWSFDVKSQKLTLNFADRLYPSWKSKKQTVNVLNDYKNTYERYGSISGDKCRFMIDFDGSYFDKNFCNR